MFSENFQFLTSPRFWKLLLVGIAAGLNAALPNNPYIMGLSVMIGVWLGGSVAVGTIDRAGKNIGGIVPAVTDNPVDPQP